MSRIHSTDWACRECVSDAADDAASEGMILAAELPAVVAGFRCVWHEARAALEGTTQTGAARESAPFHTEAYGPSPDTAYLTSQEVTERE